MPRSKTPGRKPGSGKGGKKGQTQRRYREADRVAALVALDSNGGNILRTAEQIGIPYTTLQQWACGSRHPEARIIQSKHTNDLLSAVREAVWQHLDITTDPEKLRRAPLGQNVQALNSSFGIMRTLEGKPGSIAGGVHVNVNLDLSRLTDDELRTFLALRSKATADPADPAADGLGRAGVPTGIGAAVLPRLCPPVLSADEPGPDVHPGPGDGRDSGPSGGSLLRPDRATVDPDPAGDAEIVYDDGRVPGVDVDQ